MSTAYHPRYPLQMCKYYGAPTEYMSLCRCHLCGEQGAGYGWFFDLATNDRLDDGVGDYCGMCADVLHATGRAVRVRYRDSAEIPWTASDSEDDPE